MIPVTAGVLENIFVIFIICAPLQNDNSLITSRHINFTKK